MATLKESSSEDEPRFEDRCLELGWGADIGLDLTYLIVRKTEDGELGIMNATR